MTRTIKVLPSDSVFSIEGKSQESILTAALRNGHTLNYGCSNGNCGLCKARLLDGSIEKVAHHDYSLSEQEKADNYFLMCANTAVNDVTIEALEADNPDDIAVQTVRVKVKKLDQTNDAMSLVFLQTPRTNTLRFLAGQYVEIHAKDELLGRFFIASCPCDDRNIQLHVPSTRLQSEASLKKHIASARSLQLVGPFGDFNLQERPDRPAIMLSIDEGFAPIKSLIEHAIAVEFEEPMVLLRSHKAEQLPYLENLCRSWYDAFDNIKIVNIPDPEPADLCEEILKNRRGLPDAIVYLSGPQTVTQAIAAQLLESDPDMEIRIASFAATD